MTHLNSNSLTLPSRRADKLEICLAVLVSIVLISLLQFLFSLVSTPLNNPDASATTNPSAVQQAQHVPRPSSQGTQSQGTLSQGTQSEHTAVSASTPSASSQQISLISLYPLTEAHKKLWDNGKLDQLHEALLLDAAKSASSDNQKALASTMARLGLVALQQGNSASAQVFLDESLEIFEELSHPLDIANLELLRGKLNVQQREQARRAAQTYDKMQLAGWKVAKGRFADAVPELENIIVENLALNRFGAAAFAHETLYKGYQAQGLSVEAQRSGIEVVRLHASAGRPLKAEAMLGELRNNGLDNDTIQSLNLEILGLQQRYEKSVKQLGQAKDYQQLYHHFINAGDPVRAWQFRLKANVSLRGVNKRAMHRRQSGVMALLYNSNDQMRKAEYSLQRALDVYGEYEQDLLGSYSEQLRLEIY